MPPSPPSSLPPGSWGGDADPSTAARRAQFEADLARQTEARQAALAGQPPVVGQPILAPAPAPKPPLEGGLYIPPDLGSGGDLISSMGEEELRSSNDARRAMGAPIEQVEQPRPEPVEAPPRPHAAPTAEVPPAVMGDAAAVLQAIARAVEAGLPALMRATAARIAQGRMPKDQIAAYLEAASQLVSAAVKGLTG